MDFSTRYPEIAERFERFWRGADTDRPLLYLTAPRDRPDAAVPAPPEPADRLRPDHMVAAARRRLAATAYCAEGFPHFFVNFGPGILHACIGGRADFSNPRTAWFPPFLEDLAEFPKLRFDPQCFWWRRVAEATEALLAAVGGEMLVSLTDIGGNADVVASAVGTERLLVECLDRPEAVRAAVEHVHDLWWQAYEANLGLLAAGQDVTTAWYPIVSPGRTYMTQCDFNAMIGPDVFRDLMAGELRATWARLGRAAYHLDGPGTEPHVPALLAERKPHCIQWVPLPGAGALEHLAMLRGIQEAGVSVTFTARNEAEVERACRELDRRRLMLLFACGSEAQARALVEKVRRWCGAA